MLTFAELQKANLSRVKRWHHKGLEDWSALEWAGAMAGEAGEACNAAKKLKRIESSIANITEAGRSLEDFTSAQVKIGKEAADTIIYAMLLCARLGLNPEVMVRTVFNQKSEEYGFPERI